jgi:sugar/nucleoside kinase (ribokinase family)
VNFISDVAVIGDINIDLVTSVLRRYPKKDTQELLTYARKVGGEAANSAFAMKALGLNVSFFGSTGNDALGNYIAKELKKAHLPARLIRDAKHPTGITVAITFPDGSRSMLTEEGSNAFYRFEEYKSLKGKKHVMIGGIWHCDQLNVRRILTTARKYGASTSVNMGWDTKGWTRQRRDKVFKNLDVIDILFLNTDEIKALTRKSVRDGLKMLRKQTEVALHHGEEGSVIANKEGIRNIPAKKTKKIVNTTGAGDAFNAAYIYGILRKWDAENRKIQENLREFLSEFCKSEPVPPAV